MDRFLDGQGLSQVLLVSVLRPFGPRCAGPRSPAVRSQAEAPATCGGAGGWDRGFKKEPQGLSSPETG